MAAASPTPYGGSRLSRHPSMRPVVRRDSPRDSPLSALKQSQGFSSNVLPLRRMSVGDSSDDDDEAPPEFNPITNALLENQPNSPKRQMRTAKVRVSRTNNSHTTTPAHDAYTPALSLRVKRLGVTGAPVRRGRSTPQGEDGHPPAQDQENLPLSVIKPNKSDHVLLDHGHDRDENPTPLAIMDGNAPHRAAPPPPPPKMSVLETATAAAGASTAKTKKRRTHVTINGKVYQQRARLGKGGSSDVYRVEAENGRALALKRVKLEGADEAAIIGYKGEINLLQKLSGNSRVVQLIDYHVDEAKQCLSVLMEIGESDLQKLLRTKLESLDSSEAVKLDLSFTRYYWKEMLECVAAVHAHDIVHSDLKPANFLLILNQLKLIDFGIASAIDTDNTVNIHRDSQVGTPNYMSPESLQDSNASLRNSAGPGDSVARLMRLGKPSDVWSLGCILYQMVYGRPPFAHYGGAYQRVIAIMDPRVIIEYPTHGLGGVKVPLGLRSTMKRCLLREPSERPTVADLLDEHDPFLYPDSSPDLHISQELLGLIIRRVADRFADDQKPHPTEFEIKDYPRQFYEKIRNWQENGEDRGG